MHSNSVKRWMTRGTLALPSVVAAGLALWFTRPATIPPRVEDVTTEAMDPSAVLVPAAADDKADSNSNDSDKSADKPASSASADESQEARMKKRRREQLATLPPSAQSEADANAAAEVLMREHAPHMWKRLEQMPQNGPFRLRLQRQMIERGRELQRMQQRDPEQFKHEIEQVTLEDDVADLGRQLLGRGEPSSADSETLRKSLHEQISKLVDVRIRNREARLNRLAKTLEDERKKLEEDQANRDKLVERQFQAVVNNRRPLNKEGGPPPFANPGRPRRGGAKADVNASPAQPPATSESDSSSDSKASK